MLESAIVTCPYCWESLELSLDLSAGDQIYIEDCTVCCQPMLVRLALNIEDPTDFTVTVEAEDD